MVLLGYVDQIEVGEKGLSYFARVLIADICQNRKEMVSGSFVTITVNGLARLPELLDKLKNAFTVEALDHTTERAAKQAHIIAQRLMWIGCIGLLKRSQRFSIELLETPVLE